MTCHAPECSEHKLCKAHIFPRGLARDLSPKGGHNRIITTEGSRAAGQPLGEFDPSILCSDCDNVLGRFDDYAVETCRQIDWTRVGRTGELFSHAPFDGDLFARFVLAVLWRASISKRMSWSGIKLGPYEERAATLLFDGKLPVELPGYEVVLGRYASENHDARKFYSIPVRFRSPHFNAFSFAAGGFQVIAKFDQRPFPGMFQDLVINGRSNLTAYLTRLEETVEFKLLLECAQAERMSRANMTTARSA